MRFFISSHGHAWHSNDSIEKYASLFHGGPAPQVSPSDTVEWKGVRRVFFSRIACLMLDDLKF